MSADAEFFFDFGSPNGYLAHLAIPIIEARTGARFEYVPILLGGVFKATNNVSPAVSLRGIKNKPHYQGLVTARFLKRWGLPGFTPNPHFPVDTLMLMRGAVVARREGFFARYVDEMFRHMWREPKKLDDPEVLAATFAESGLPTDVLFAGIGDDAVKQELRARTDDAVTRGIFGIPSFIVGGELYFGKDTLPEVEEELLARRGADHRLRR